MASAISRRPWPTFTTARPAKPSSSFLPRSVQTHTPSARSITSSSSASHGWSRVLCVQRCLIASPLVAMGRASRRLPDAIISRMFIVGIDVGGTFTDLTAADEATGRVVVTKVPSERHNQAAAGAEALAVCLLHAYLNPAHERAVADAAKGRYPGLPVSCSADVVAEYREFERFSTTVLNAYLQPIMDGYLAGLEERLRATGYAHGVLTVASSGGMMTTETARRLPIKTIFSGPAGGVSQACFVGEAAGARDFITYDMGGTSTDVCLVRDLAPLTTSDGMLGAFPVKVPQLDMHSVGAGGGSIAWLDLDGSLQVGPRSAGATPGPAAYGLGGTDPTVTDANVVLGRIGTTKRLGGSITLDPGKARAAVAALAGRMTGLGAEALA